VFLTCCAKHAHDSLTQLVMSLVASTKLINAGPS